MSTTTSPRTATAASTEAYGLRLPTVVDARAALERIYGPGADARWTELTAQATSGVARAVTVESIVDVMLASEDGVIRLCGQAVKIRLRSFTHLAAASTLVS